MKTREISKKLSANDIGITGGHQAGILVPRKSEILDFFPKLQGDKKNPRAVLSVAEWDSGGRWQFIFIYYNNKFFGGTRNEYRLTHMTGFLRSINAKVGDELVFFRDENFSCLVRLVRSTVLAVEEKMGHSSDILVLSGGWKVINF